MVDLASVFGHPLTTGLTAGWWTGIYPIQTLLLALFLGTLVALAFRFPIHVRHNAKIHMNSVPLYLMAALLPPLLAAAVAGLAMLVGELWVVRRRRNGLRGIAIQSSRWVVLTFLGSAVAHIPVNDLKLHAMPFTAAAIVLWTGDMLTAPLLLLRRTPEKRVALVVGIVREAGILQGAEYLVGLMGALIAQGQQEIWALALLFLPTVLVYFAFRNARELRDGTRQILETMADTVDVRDPYTGGHSRRVTELTAGILESLRIDKSQARLIIAAARVHDIGKIGVPDFVLKKPDNLSAEEKVMMQTHPDQGAELLTRYPDFRSGVDIVRHHHERWDGAGYPYGLKEREIPLGARIISVANSFDTMTTDRPHRSALSLDRAVAILRQGRGREWDPIVVDAFLQSIAYRLDRPASILRVLPEGEGTRDSAITA